MSALVSRKVTNSEYNIIPPHINISITPAFSFGFNDGISQPGVEGYTTEPYKGQRVVDAGVILLGNGKDTRTSKLATDGSFLVFRKLNQLVPEFNSFLFRNGTGLGGLQSPAEGAKFLGARLFGRWQSGAPTDITPFKDDPKLANDIDRRNNFQFTFLYPDDQIDQARCPFAAHIRKSYPRGDLEKDGRNVDENRIIRHGCPFGPEVAREEDREGRTYHERGLAFACYQSNIDKGFVRIQRGESGFSSCVL